MIKKIIKISFSLMIAFSTVGGAVAFYQILLSKNDYGLTLYLKDSEKIIENNRKTLGLSVVFNEVEINSLYLSRIQLINSGTRALTKDFIYEPLVINIGTPNKILQTNPSAPFITHTDNTITIKWDLLNPNEVIKLSLFTTEPINLKTSHKIKEISGIDFVNEIANPPANARLQSISVIWFVLAINSLFMALDAIILLMADPKLGRVFTFIRSLPEVGSVNKEAFLAELLSRYEDYYRSVPWLIVKPNELISKLSNKLSPSELISGSDLEMVKTETIAIVRHENLYTLRAMNVFLGPLLFGLCIIRIAIALFV